MAGPVDIHKNGNGGLYTMKKYDFIGKTVIITGAMNDIGTACAIRFLENGANVVVSDTNEKPEIMEVLYKVSSNVAFVSCNICNWDEDVALVDKAVCRFGRVDILVNNAGVNEAANERKAFHEYDRELWDKIIETENNGTFFITQAFAQHIIRAEKSGSVVNIGSIIGVNPARNYCAHTVTKAGLVMFTRVAALELAPYNIRVNCISVGAVNCDGRNPHIAHVPMQRPGTADEVACGVLYLASDESSYITGNNMNLDGGWSCGFTRNW